MGIQAEKLVSHLGADGVSVGRYSTNAPVPSFLSGIMGVRTVCRLLTFVAGLVGEVRRSDVLHILSAAGLSFWSFAVPTLLLGKLYGRRVILNQRAGGTGAFLDRWSWLVRPFLRLADEIAVPSGFLQADFARHGVEVAILPNIVDLDLFPFRPRQQLRPRLIITRHLSPLYNVPCAIRAFACLKRRYPDAVLGIVGTGRTEHESRAVVRELGLDGVTFYGYVPHTDLPAVYAKYDIAVNSSNVDNYPGAIIEAFASGLPVVSTAAGGIPFMISDGENGLLVPKNDHDALAERVTWLLDNSGEAARMARAAREWVRRNRWEAVSRVVRRLYGLENVV
jgi:glycosyltransferase involved in cell wall biosynthesis